MGSRKVMPTLDNVSFDDDLPNLRKKTGRFLLGRQNEGGRSDGPAANNLLATEFQGVLGLSRSLSYVWMPLTICRTMAVRNMRLIPVKTP